MKVMSACSDRDSALASQVCEQPPQSCRWSIILASLVARTRTLLQWSKTERGECREAKARSRA